MNLRETTSSERLSFVRDRLGGDMMQRHISRLRALSGYTLNVMAAVDLLFRREHGLIDDAECDARAVALRNGLRHLAYPPDESR